MLVSHEDSPELRRVRNAAIADEATIDFLMRMGIPCSPASTDPAQHDWDVIIFHGRLLHRMDAVELALEWEDPHQLQDALSYPHHWSGEPEPLDLVRGQMAYLAGSADEEPNPARPS